MMFLLLALVALFLHVDGKPRVAVEDPSVPSLSLHCLESEALSFLGSDNDFSDAYCGKTIQHCMERGWFQVTAILVAECRSRNFKVAGPVYKAKSNLNKQLNIITNLLSGPSAIISPAFQWSQSKDYILLNVKFAHKLDTPATLGVKSKGADITSTGILFEAASKSKNKRFKLSLTLARAIVPEESEWSMAAVGRATFSLKKKHPETAWMNLLDSKQAEPRNMHTWWAMKEQHDNDVKSLEMTNTDAPAIAKAKKERAENNDTDTTTPLADHNPSKQPDTVATTTEEAAPGVTTAPSGEAIKYQKMLDDLLEEKAKARKNILHFSTKKTKEVLDQMTRDMEVERTRIQRNKVKALQNMDAEYAEKLDALGRRSEL